MVGYDHQHIAFDGTKYEENIICYLDILGYSSLMLSKNENQKKKILGFQKDFIIRQGGITVEDSITTLRTSTALLSDTIIYTYPVKEFQEAEVCNAFEVVAYDIERNITYLQLRFLQNGLLSRGSIVAGKIYNHGNKVFGEGLALAHSAEKNVEKNSMQLYIHDSVNNLPMARQRVYFNNYFSYQDSNSVKCTNFNFLNSFFESWVRCESSEKNARKFLKQIDLYFAGIDIGKNFARQCQQGIEKWDWVEKTLITLLSEYQTRIIDKYQEYFPLDKTLTRVIAERSSEQLHVLTRNNHDRPESHPSRGHQDA